MRPRGVLAIISFISWLFVAPTAGRACCHHNHRCGDYYDCAPDCYGRTQASEPARPWAPSSGVPDLRTAEGRITEVVYLPGATPESAMVEIRLQSAGQDQLVRLAPVGLLKQEGLLLKEGDTVTVKGFLVAGMEGDLLVATELHKSDKTLTLRDASGIPLWSHGRRP